MHQILIGGAWVDAATRSSREIVNPATLKALGSVPECGRDDVERAVGAARAALPGWRQEPAASRAGLLHEIGGRLRGHARELGELLTRETGKPLCESLDCIAAAAAVFERCASIIESAGAASGAASSGDSTSGGAHCGVVAAIVPFNFPLLMMAVSIAPALAAGHTVVCKPPPQNPLASLKLAELHASLPPGVVNVITGGADTGHALTQHPGIDRLAFTGSAEVGRRVAAAAQGKKLDLELGSVDPFIICKDANLELAVPGIAWARLMNGGQGCTLGGHMYVERSIAAEFVERMHQCVGFLDVDDPIKPPTDLGPLISLEAAHRVEDQVGRALRAGAKLILGGRRFRPSGLPGHFFQPTILTDVRPGSVPTREEIAGPVITVTPVADVAEAIRLAHDSGPLVGASIYTADSAAAAKTLASVAGGVFRINDPAADEATGPFAGMRHAGIRRTLGAEGQHKHIVAAPELRRRAWWFPYLDRPRG
jgi:acyl-CoA reductase-like NAD-dependent aldehyde dehydrogenase